MQNSYSNIWSAIWEWYHKKMANRWWKCKRELSHWGRGSVETCCGGFRCFQHIELWYQGSGVWRFSTTPVLFSVQRGKPTFQYFHFAVKNNELIYKWTESSVEINKKVLAMCQKTYAHVGTLWTKHFDHTMHKHHICVCQQLISDITGPISLISFVHIYDCMLKDLSWLWCVINTENTIFLYHHWLLTHSSNQPGGWSTTASVYISRNQLG